MARVLSRCVGALVALVALALVSACGDSPSPPVVRASALTVSGTVTVIGTRPAVLTDNELTCTTGGGYADIREGAQVVVTDAADTTIALGRLGYGSWDRKGACTFLFAVPSVPVGQQFYGVEVANRGRLQYTAVQLAAPLALTIGG